MEKLRLAGLILLAAVMVLLMLATWSSVGSVVMAMGLISMGSALLYRRFLNRDDADNYSDFQ